MDLESQKSKKRVIKAKDIAAPIVIMLVLWTAGIILWLTTDYLFYLVNFLYIGTSIGIGISLYIILPKNKKHIGRKLSQFLVGVYMLVFLGFFMFENMQIEGFYFYLLLGVFAGAVIHYLIGKVFGPVIFNRGWCGWACWTAMILDLLPYSKNEGRVRKLGYIRYFHFFLSIAVVVVLWFLFGMDGSYRGINELYWLIGGNILYYVIGILMAVIMKDNRAFCKYVCPITVFLKPFSKISLMKIKADRSKCNMCGSCEKACPMDIKITEYIKKGKRVLSSECIVCNDCINACPRGALDMSFGFDFCIKELISFKD